MNMKLGEYKFKHKTETNGNTVFLLTKHNYS